MSSDPPKARQSQDLRRALRYVRAFLGRVLDIRGDANIPGTIETINKDTVFAGPNVWVLICSIFIASIGLDTNSVAVIIGAMLISPLMGPILGIGLSVGVNDLDALRRALRHFAVMTLVALLTSTAYFALTPFGASQPELLARTRPTLLDAAIAFFGGVAGIIGVSRRERNNVIPGVAIATALMPPLCTAGFGLANASWQFFLGAIYLFALNCVFIATATVAVVRYLGFPLVAIPDQRSHKWVRLRIAAFMVVVLIPSAWIMFNVVREDLFRRRAADFISQNVAVLDGVAIISQRITYADSLSAIEVVLTGDSVPAGLETQLQQRMASAGLANTVLRLHVPTSPSLGDLSQEIRVGIIEDLYERQATQIRERDQRIAELETSLAGFAARSVPIQQITEEVSVQYPEVAGLSFGTLIGPRLVPDEPGLDTVPVAVVRWERPRSDAARGHEQDMLRDWLRVRLQLDTLEMIHR
ncbi:MAG: DUF389 domain-containing protein [Gemmatimonadales bacterium]